MKSFLSSLLTAVTMVLITAGLSFGQTTLATWPLDSTTSVMVMSNVTADTEAVAGLTADYQSGGTSAPLPTGATSPIQKLLPNAATSTTSGTGTWFNLTGPDSAQYVQFMVTAQMGFSMHLDSISMLIGAKGINKMNAAVFYSGKSSFADSTMLGEISPLPQDAVMDTSFALDTVLNAGDTLYVRVYPWLSTSTTSTSKYLYVGNVAAHGYAMGTPMAIASGNNELWNFKADSLGDSLNVMSWGSGNAAAVVVQDTINKDNAPTNHILKFINRNYNSAPFLEVVLPAGKTMADYNSFNFQLFMAQGDVSQKTFLVKATSTMPSGPFDNGADTNYTIGSYYRSSQTASTGWENISIPINGSFSMTDTVYITFGINASGSSSGLRTIWYAQNVQLVQNTSTASPLTLWGIDPSWNAPGWILNVTDNGDSANFNGGVVKAWAGIRGAFKHPLVGTTAPSGAIVVSGKVTFVGEGPDVPSGMRYGIYNTLTPGVLTGASGDSAYWKGQSTASYGYTFSPQSGTDELPSSYSFGGSGAAQWIVMGGDWLSSYGGAVGFGPYVVQQAPARAAMPTGTNTYDFAFSVHPQANGSKLVSYYLIQKNSSGQIVYWDAATLTDTTSQTRSDTLNSIEFGVEGGPKMTGMIFSDVVDSLGPDISIPEEPWSNYYISEWGIYGKNTGGWTLTPGSIIGNTTISGASKIPNFQHAAVLGALVTPTSGRNGKDSTLYITGDLAVVGGPIQAANSFSFGLYNTSMGNLDSTQTVGYQWTGANDMDNGYLFIPPSGNAQSPIWQVTNSEQGNAGAVVSQPWESTNGKGSYVMAAVHQSPMGAVIDTGNYVFAISVAPEGNGSQLVGATLYKPDSSYVWTASIMDSHSPLSATAFNSLIFGLQGGNATTGLDITNVQAELAPPVSSDTTLTAVASNPSSNIPRTFALLQNYPNPFNPSTTIEYQLPKAVNVTVKVYNVLGQEVATLVNAKESAGVYRLSFNMDSYASGVYFVRMVAGSYVHMDKMMLIK